MTFTFNPKIILIKRKIKIKIPPPKKEKKINSRKGKKQNHRKSTRSCVVNGLGTLSEAEENHRESKPLTATLLFLLFYRESADLFSGFTQITSSCSQIFRERHRLRNALPLPLHTEKALHFSPNSEKNTYFKDPEIMRQDAP